LSTSATKRREFSSLGDIFSQWEIAIFGHLGLRNPEPIELKFGMVDYVQHTTPHAKIDLRRVRDIGWGRGEFATSRTFLCRRPSVCLSVVCRLSFVCNVRAPYSADWNFRQCFCAM